MHRLVVSLVGILLTGYGYNAAGLPGAFFVGGLVTALGLGSGLILHFSRQRKPARSKPSRAPHTFDLDDADQARLALDVAAEYGVAMEKSGPCHYHSASLLPYPAETIRAALEALLQYAEGRTPSAYLSSMKIHPSNLVESLRTGLRSLDDYLDVPGKTIPAEPTVNSVFGGAIRQGMSVVEARKLARLHQRRK
jgi:hypothetical protein